MELGGNAPFLVFEDADLDAAVDGAMIAKMRNGGEACTAANRFYVHADVADEFSRRLAERMAALRVGPGTADDTEVGPLVNEESAAKVAELVDGAVADGARVVLGGTRPDREGFYYDPTVLLDVPRGAGILGEEIFGPVAPVVTFTDEDDAIRMANDTEYGLVSYVYTARPGPRPARQRAPRLRHGRPQPRPRLRPRRPLRRHQAVRHRPRGRPRGDARLPGVASTSPSPGERRGCGGSAEVAQTAARRNQPPTCDQRSYRESWHAQPPRSESGPASLSTGPKSTGLEPSNRPTTRRTVTCELVGSST